MAHPGLPTHRPPTFDAALAELNARERLDLEAMKLMILLETAGDPLYRKLAEGAGSERVAELLRANAREETAHAHRLARAIEILTGEPFEIPPLEENPYVPPPPLPPVTPELLEGVRGAELAGEASYLRYAEAEPKPEVAELLRANGREERRHAERVAEAIAILRERGDA